MHSSTAVPSTCLALLLATLPLAGCQRRPSEPARQAVPSAVPAGQSGATTDLPAGVLHAYVWKCDDGQTLKMRNLFRERSIAIDLHEGTRKLPQVASADGARYQDAAVMFWTRGGEATFQRQGGPTVRCREIRAQSLLENARVRERRSDRE